MNNMTPNMTHKFMNKTINMFTTFAWIMITSRTTNLEVTTKRLLHQLVKIPG